MAFQLNEVVPLGRNIKEYQKMFCLEEQDMTKKLAGFGDGPASFNYEATCQGCSVTSFDPIYQFSKEDLQKRIETVRNTVMDQMRKNKDNYVWTNIKSIDELEKIRMSAMGVFLEDYEKGREEGRYVYHELPETLPYGNQTFDIGLSSHFLLMYTALGYEFHIQAMEEMLRVCKEIRIFPIVDLDAHNTKLANDVIHYFEKEHEVEIVHTQYEFQKGDNKLLIIR